jgi:hypothetical protein
MSGKTEWGGGAREGKYFIKQLTDKLPEKYSNPLFYPDEACLCSTETEWKVPRSEKEYHRLQMRRFYTELNFVKWLDKGRIHKERLDKLNAFSDELIKFAHRNEMAVVIAHGMLNRELVKILKVRGWEFCKNGQDKYGNLSVNCLKHFSF